jgi:ornithine cyclodeaminase/alanine dehydrogenase-like protein (mu-crystallin family)
MLILSDDQVRRLADPGQVIETIRKAFARDYASTVHMPMRTSMDIGDGGVLLIMPAYDSAIGVAGVKTVTVTRSSGVKATYELIDAASGLALAHMQASYMTELRTAATSAVATDLLARPEAKTLGIFGSGPQAEAHFAMVSRVRNFQRFLVSGSGRKDLSPFIASMRQRFGLPIESVAARTCAAESDVICTCTNSSVPVFAGEWLRPGTHINAVGAYQPTTREIDEYAIVHSRVVVDTCAGALAEAGEILIPMQSNVIDKSHIVADLHEIASGKKAGRLTGEDITLFKSLGCALEDLVTAQLIYHLASVHEPHA